MDKRTLGDFSLVHPSGNHWRPGARRLAAEEARRCTTARPDRGEICLWPTSPAHGTSAYAPVTCLCSAHYSLLYIMLSSRITPQQTFNARWSVWSGHPVEVPKNGSCQGWSFLASEGCEVSDDPLSTFYNQGVFSCSPLQTATRGVQQFSGCSHTQQAAVLCLFIGSQFHSLHKNRSTHYCTF